MSAHAPALRRTGLALLCATLPLAIRAADTRPPHELPTPVAPAAALIDDTLRRDLARADRLIARMRDADTRLTPDWHYCWTENEGLVLAYVPGQPGALLIDTVTRQRALLNVGTGTGSPELAFADGDRIVFYAGGGWWAVDRVNGACAELDAKASQEADARWDLRRAEHGEAARTAGRKTAIIIVRNDSGRPLDLFWRDASGRNTAYGRIEVGASREQSTYAGHTWELRDPAGTVVERFTVPESGGVITVREPGTQPETTPPGDTSRPAPAATTPAETAPKTTWRDARLVTREPGKPDKILPLRTRSADERVYAAHPFPDGATVLALLRDEPPVRRLTYVESRPKSGGAPREFSFEYAKPGDRIAQLRATVADVAGGREHPVDETLFADLWELRPLGHSPVADEALLYLHDRTHQRSRVIAIGRTGAVRTLVDERSATFIDYSQKTIVRVLPKTGHLLWASERDGRNRIYRYDLRTGALINTATPGPGIVQSIESVDEDAGTLDCVEFGVHREQDPMYRHLVRHRLDGTGAAVILTRGDGMHSWQFSPARRHLVDTWSRMDMPPSVAIREARTGDTLAELTKGDPTAIPKGYPVAERFTAKGRDGKTPIHGLIFRPAGYKLGDRLPVLELIYAGPHDFHVPKAWRTRDFQVRLAELGYAVVCIDGMGTNWRDKAFHDVCYKNLRDAGYPDRIAWIRAAAKAHPELDITKVGVIGSSAGGQNAVSALIRHPDFYRVAVANCGCHDNRIDKLWWNEAWMGWPVDASYAENSNIEHAAKLRGALLLTLGEIDTNVDVACTRDLSAALFRAGIPHELHVAPGGGHFALFENDTFAVAAAFLRKHLPPE